jgi:hypothetical protein
VATVREIREALASNLLAIEGAQISPYRHPNPTPPILFVLPGPPGGGDFTEYHKAMGNGLETMTFTVRAEVGVISDLGAQMRRDEYLDVSGSSSVKQAVESDKTLGGLVSDLIVTRSQAGELQTQGGVPRLAADWEVVVYT